MGIRLGPKADGEKPNEAPALRKPPALRKTSVRELMAALSAPCPAGRPPTMNSAAPPGLSRVGYQSAEVAFSSRDAIGCVFVPLVGTAPQAH